MNSGILQSGWLLPFIISHLCQGQLWGQWPMFLVQLADARWATGILSSKKLGLYDMICLKIH